MQPSWEEKNEKNFTCNPHFITLGATGKGKSLSVFKMALDKFQDAAKNNNLQLSELSFDINDVNHSLVEVQNILINGAGTESTFNILVKHKDKILDGFSIVNKPVQTFERVYSKEEQMNDMLEHIKEIAGINITEDQLTVLLNKNVYLKEQLNKYTFYDTVVREGVSSMISETFVGEEWPKFGDNLTDKELEDFVQKIRASASKMGYEIDNNKEAE